MPQWQHQHTLFPSNGRNGATMTVQTQDSGNLTVLLTDSTQVLEPEGVFRKKHLAMTALVLGLLVEVQGSYKDHNQLVADKVTFHGSDLKTAEDIQAGIPQLNSKFSKARSKSRHKSNKLSYKSSSFKPSSRRAPSTPRQLRRTRQRSLRRTSASANWATTTS